MFIYQYKIKTPDCCFFRGNPYGLLQSVFECCHWYLLIIIDFSFLGYFSMSAALRSGFSGPWKLSPALRSSLTAFWSFFLPGCLFLVLLLLYLKCYKFERAFLSSSSFYPTLFCHIWCMHWLNLLLSTFPWDSLVLPWGLQDFPQWFAT